MLSSSCEHSHGRCVSTHRQTWCFLATLWGSLLGTSIFPVNISFRSICSQQRKMISLLILRRRPVMLSGVLKCCDNVDIMHTRLRFRNLRINGMCSEISFGLDCASLQHCSERHCKNMRLSFASTLPSIIWLARSLNSLRYEDLACCKTETIVFTSALSSW